MVFGSWGKGDRAPPKKRATLVLIGLTGAGKSTLINVLWNALCKQGEFSKETLWSQLRVLIPNNQFEGTETESAVAATNETAPGQNNNGSSTKEPRTYEHIGADGREFRLVDTPGLNDTRGVQQDAENIKLIVKKIQEAEEVNAIVVVVNGTDCREHTALRSLFIELANTPRDFIERIILVCTMADKSTSTWKGPRLENFKQKMNVFPAAVFYMQNNVFDQGKDTYEDPEELDELLRHFKASLAVADKILDKAMAMKPMSTDSYRLLQEHKDKLREAVDCYVKTLGEMGIKLEALAHMQSELSQGNATKNANASYTVVKPHVYYKMSSVDYRVTVCSACNNACHEKCLLNDTPLGSPAFRLCWAFWHDGSIVPKANEETRQNCRVCESKCGKLCNESSHYHTYNIPLKVETTTQEIVEDIRKKYMDANATVEQCQAKIHALQASFQSNVESQASSVARVREQCRGIQEMCPRFNFNAELDNAIEQLQQQQRVVQYDSLKDGLKDSILGLQRLREDLIAMRQNMA